MKKIVYSILGVSLLSMLLLSGCKKEDEPDPKKSTVQNDQTGATEADNVMDDVNDFISNKIGAGAAATSRTAGTYNLPCGVVSVDSSTSTGGRTIYKFNYGNQTACGYKYKSGQIAFNLTNGTKFSDVGAIYTITFTNYSVEVRATGSIVTLNGAIHVTNVDGRHIWEIMTGQVITHTLRGQLNITYDNGTTRVRNYFQKRIWDSSDNTWLGFSLTIDGDSVAGADKILETGRTYDGDYAFKTIMNTPYVWANCNATSTTSDDWMGPYVLKTGDATLDLTVPLISPTTIDVEGGYYWNYTSSGSTPVLMNDCMSNTYKITTTIGTNVSTTYQLY